MPIPHGLEYPLKGGGYSFVLNPAWNISLESLDALLAFAAFILIVRSKSLSVFWPMLPITLSRVVPVTALLLLRQYRVLSERQAYETYFLSYYSCFIIAAVCSALLTYLVFAETLRPLKGLQSLGRIVYRWVASISVAIALGAVLIPSPNTGSGFQVAAMQIERASGIIVLSLVLFVAFAVRPLGLSWRSRIFGTSIGIALASVMNLYISIAPMSGDDMWNLNAAIGMILGCFADLIWIYYFWVPEPKRKFVLLPTTSPFHAWNQISEILGHDPGYVAIGGVPPEAFAPAELDIFERASRNMALADSGGQAAAFLGTTHYSVNAPRSLSSSEASERLSSAWRRENDPDRK